MPITTPTRLWHPSQPSNSTASALHRQDRKTSERQHRDESEQFNPSTPQTSSSSSQSKLQHKSSGLFRNVPLLSPQPALTGYVPQSQRSARTKSTAARVEAANEKDRTESWISCMEMSLQITAARTGSRAKTIEEAATLEVQENAKKREKIENLVQLHETLIVLQRRIMARYDVLLGPDGNGETRSNDSSHSIRGNDIDGDGKRERMHMISLADSALKLAEELYKSEQDESVELDAIGSSHRRHGK